ncbi:AraC-like DNA-binding protein [Tahibacter aquaticus]|uniref:AraC-like DNA-binding protein n=1 Tax=Tahibacter aquaticus TaxID=520092 RepID=A0A4R6Z209_9GAMM|nr:AraC family transcriptional regulator [Tahibacter aquaticus]TDR45625.1 AraC-like DNA-binding protein [Tahibacter aquaticus]
MWIGSGAAYFAGDVRDNDLHAHYVLQIAIASGDPLRVTERHGLEHCASGIIIPSGKPHCVRGSSAGETEALLLFLEPATDLGRLVTTHYALDAGQIVDISPTRVEAVRQIYADSGETGEPLLRGLVAALTSSAWRSRSIDRRVACALDYIDHHLCDADSLDHVAERLSVTSRYLRKLFERELGISPQRYRQWCKLRTALTCVLRGDTFTDAAATAGFTDSAHFSRTFRSMFGSSPSAVFDSAASRRSISPVDPGDESALCAFSSTSFLNK